MITLIRTPVTALRSQVHSGNLDHGKTSVMNDRRISIINEETGPEVRSE